MTLNDLVGELESIENREDLCEALEVFIQEFKERNVRGFVYVVYVGKNLYKIGKTTNLERRLKELNETRIVQIIKANNISLAETQLHNKFASKRVSPAQEIFKLNDEDVLYIHMIEEDPHLSLFT